MKNTSYKNKQFVLLGMTFLSVAGIAGCSKVELAQSSVTLAVSYKHLDVYKRQPLFHDDHIVHLDNKKGAVKKE